MSVLGAVKSFAGLDRWPICPSRGRDGFEGWPICPNRGRDGFEGWPICPNRGRDGFEGWAICPNRRADASTRCVGRFWPLGGRLRPDEAVGFGRRGDGFDQMSGLISPCGERLRPDERVDFAVGRAASRRWLQSRSRWQRGVWVRNFDDLAPTSVGSLQTISTPRQSARRP